MLVTSVKLGETPFTEEGPIYRVFFILNNLEFDNVLIHFFI